MASGRVGWEASARRCGLALALVWMAVPSMGQAQTTSPQGGEKGEVDPEARRILLEMSDFLAGQRAFTVHTEGSQDVVLDDGQKVQINRSGIVEVQRPDRLRVDRSGDLANLQLYYDGRHLTLYGARDNAFATVEAPPTLDAMLEMAAERGLDAPGADLLVSSPFQALMEDVQSGSYLGRSTIDGVVTHHLAFRNRSGVDWEIWIADGPRPLPSKYVVTSRDLPESPQYTVTLSDWNLSPAFTRDQFRFMPPPGALEVSFLDGGAK